MPIKRRRGTSNTVQKPAPPTSTPLVDDQTTADCKAAVDFIKRARTRGLSTAELLDIIAVQAAVRADRTMFKGDPNKIVALLLRRSNKTVNSVWSQYKATGNVVDPSAASAALAAPKAPRRTHRLQQSQEMEEDVWEFIRERSVKRTQTVAKDVLMLLVKLGYMKVDDSDAEDFQAALRCVQRFLNSQGYKRGRLRGGIYRQSAENLARRDEYVPRIAVKPAIQSRRKVYLDESYVHHNYTRHHDSLFDPSDPLVTKAKHKGRRYCFIAAIVSEDTSVEPSDRVDDKAAPLIDKSVDIFEGGKKVKDYHAMFDHDYMVKWMTTLLDALDEKGLNNCIMVEYRQSSDSTRKLYASYLPTILRKCRGPPIRSFTELFSSNQVFFWECAAGSDWLRHILSEPFQKYGYAHTKRETVPYSFAYPHYSDSNSAKEAMNLSQLQSKNTLKAKTIAENVFKRFLDEAHVDMAYVASCVRSDPSGAILVSLVDRFGVYLAFLESKNGQKLAHNTVMQYFRQAKLWLLSLFPQSSAHVEAALLKKSGLLDRYCKTRPESTMVKQASGCSKDDSYLLMRYIYTSASSPSDYQDVALLSMLWYLFGRASDLTLLRKQNLSMCGGNVLFVRFVRVKTSQENGLSLFPDSSMITCPITAIAAALAMQSTPNEYLLPHLPAPTSADITELGPLVPLADVLSGVTIDLDLLAISDDAGQPHGRKAAAPGIHSYVNRLLSRISEPAGVVTTLTSHSFRRGGAQAANGSPDLTLQWIADRGGWSMSATNKAFQYIFNTTQEDQKVSKVLSGWDSKAAVPIVSMDAFDTLTRQKLDALKSTLFACCSGLQMGYLNVSPMVTDVLCAHLIKAFPELKALQPTSPLVRRVESALGDVGVEYEELLAWAIHLAQEVGTTKAAEEKMAPQDVALLKAQAAALDEMVGVTKKLSLRLKEVEAQLNAKRKRSDSIEGSATPAPANEDVNMEQPDTKKRKQSPSLRLIDVWYDWYAAQTYTLRIDTKKVHEVRKVVSFMDLFAGPYELDDGAVDFRDRVLEVGGVTVANVEAFFAEHKIKARSSGTALKAFRNLYKTGVLDRLIADYKIRMTAGLVIDPVPVSKRCILEPSLLPDNQ